MCTLLRISRLSFIFPAGITYRQRLCCKLSCLTLSDRMDCSPPGSSVHGIFQARILEWVTISSSRGSSQPRDRTQVSCIASGFFTAEPSGKPPGMVLLIYCWIRFANMLLRIFALMFICNIGLYFSFLWYLWFWCQWCWSHRMSLEVYLPLQFCGRVWVG